MITKKTHDCNCAVVNFSESQHYAVNFCLDCSPLSRFSYKDLKSFIQGFLYVSIQETDENKKSQKRFAVYFNDKLEAIRFSLEVSKIFKVLYTPVISAYQGYTWKCIYFEREKVIQKKLQALLGGETEVKNPAGRIDLLTNTQVIEIKKFKDWKEAIGQIVVYGSFYPDRQKVVYLFDRKPQKLLDVIKGACGKQKILIEFYLDEGWSYGDEEQM